jgi:hypothetical protein
MNHSELALAHHRCNLKLGEPCSFELFGVSYTVLLAEEGEDIGMKCVHARFLLIEIDRGKWYDPTVPKMSG